MRKNWIPPDSEKPISRAKLEPGRLHISNMNFHQDSNEESTRLREERLRELEEVRRSFAEKRESNEWNTPVVGNSLQSYQRELEEVRRSFAEKKESNDWNTPVVSSSLQTYKPESRSSSRLSNKQKFSDDFWIKEAKNNVHVDSAVKVNPTQIETHVPIVKKCEQENFKPISSIHNKEQATNQKDSAVSDHENVILSKERSSRKRYYFSQVN